MDRIISLTQMFIEVINGYRETLPTMFGKRFSLQSIYRVNIYCQNIIFFAYKLIKFYNKKTFKIKKTLPMAWQKASSQMNIRPQKKFNMIKLKKKKIEKIEKNLKMPYFPFI